VLQLTGTAFIQQHLGQISYVNWFLFSVVHCNIFYNLSPEHTAMIAVIDNIGGLCTLWLKKWTSVTF